MKQAMRRILRASHLTAKIYTLAYFILPSSSWLIGSFIMYANTVQERDDDARWGRIGKRKMESQRKQGEVNEHCSARSSTRPTRYTVRHDHHHRSFRCEPHKRKRTLIIRTWWWCNGWDWRKPLVMGTWPHSTEAADGESIHRSQGSQPESFSCGSSVPEVGPSVAANDDIDGSRRLPVDPVTTIIAILLVRPQSIQSGASISFLASQSPVPLVWVVKQSPSWTTSGRTPFKLG